jgi:hypothetical protein
MLESGEFARAPALYLGRAELRTGPRDLNRGDRLHPVFAAQRLQRATDPLARISRARAIRSPGGCCA